MDDACWCTWFTTVSFLTWLHCIRKAKQYRAIPCEKSTANLTNEEIRDIFHKLNLSFCWEPAQGRAFNKASKRAINTALWWPSAPVVSSPHVRSKESFTDGGLNRSFKNVWQARSKHASYCYAVKGFIESLQWRYSCFPSVNSFFQNSADVFRFAGLPEGELPVMPLHRAFLP